jgi:O-antigen ligase
MTAIRSIAFATSALLAIAVVRGSRHGRAAAVPPPGTLLAMAFAALFAWSLASLAWSVNVGYTLREFRGELMWNALTLLVFYVAAGVPRGWPVLTTTALASFAVSALIAIGAPLVRPGFTASFWYGDTGFFSTLITLIAPIALTVPERSPKPIASIATIALVAIALVAARESQNRIVFIALAVLFAIAAGLAALRWRGALGRTRMRWAIALVALAIALGALFVDAARDKALRAFPPRTSIAETFAEDPRIALWEQTATRIAERPWTGHGYGRAILAPELRAAMGGELYSHPHNMIGSQWLQTGAIGVALLALAFAALVGCYASFYRSADDHLAFVGLVGIALVAGFIVKNLTDDFLYRSGAREFYALNALLIGWGTRRRWSMQPRAGA